MKTSPSPNVYQQFASILAPLLAEQLAAAGGSSVRFTATTPGADPSLSEPLVLGLRFEGALAGSGFLVLGQEDAARLAEGAPDPRALLAIAVQAVCEPFGAGLFARYGTVHVHPLEDTELAEDTTPLVTLASAASRAEDEAPSSEVLFYVDGELRRSLDRLARVALAAELSGITSGNLGLVMDVELQISLRFGQRQLSLREVMDLNSGSVVELDREVDEPVELILDGRVIARGEAVIVDGNYGVRVTEVLHPMVG